MCVTSVVYDYFQTQPATIWQPDTYALLQQVLGKLGELDAKLGQPDCEDPAKAAWMREVEQRLSELEAPRSK